MENIDVFEESEALTTCAFCHQEHDEKERIPKLLSCSHKVCPVCLKGLNNKARTRRRMSCLICHQQLIIPKDIATLPTCKPTLHIIKLMRKTNDDEFQKSITRWCVHCNTPTKAGCSHNQHQCIEVASGFTENLENLLSLKGELVYRNERYQNHLLDAIQKIEEKQLYSLLITEVLLHCLADQKSKQEEYQASIADLTSLLTRVLPQVCIILRFTAKEQQSADVRSLQEWCDIFKPPEGEVACCLFACCFCLR